MINKNDIVTLAAQKSGFTKKDTAEALEAVITSIIEQTKAGEIVNIAGFGRFEAPVKPARECRNPQDGSTITVAAHRAPKFKPAQGFKDAVNE